MGKNKQNANQSTIIVDWDAPDPILKWTEQKLDETKRIVDKATKIAKAETNLKYNLFKGQPDKTYQNMLNKEAIFLLQKDLYNKGYNSETNLDGKWGKKTELALMKARKDGYTLNNGKLIAPNKDNYTKSNSPYALAHRFALGKIYPYDYSEITFDPNNVSAYNEFLDLDLNTPEGLQRAKEIRKMQLLDGKPVFSNRGISNNSVLQQQFRERYDLLALNAGMPQKYGSFRLYTDEKGNIFYEFTNLDTNKRYTDRAYNTKKRFGTKENGLVLASKHSEALKKDVEYIPRDLTNVLFNLYNIKGGSDNLGNYTEVEDVWNLAPTEFLPGNSIAPKIKIRQYDDAVSSRESGTEDMIVPNSVYDKYGGGSVRYDSDREASKEYYPLNLSYVKNTIFKPLVNKHFSKLIKRS